VPQVSPHEIIVVYEENYMEFWSEMGDWVEDDGIDDAPEEPAAADTVSILYPNTVRFRQIIGAKLKSLTLDFSTMICRTQLTMVMSKTTTQQRRQAFWVL
jgi:hypothetical protein